MISARLPVYRAVDHSMLSPTLCRACRRTRRHRRATQALHHRVRADEVPQHRQITLLMIWLPVTFYKHPLERTVSLSPGYPPPGYPPQGYPPQGYGAPPPVRLWERGVLLRWQ